MAVLSDRPEPLMKALRAVAPAVAALAAVVTGLGSAGLLSATQVQTVNDYGDLVIEAAAPNGPLVAVVSIIIALINGGVVLVGVLKAGKGAQTEVTPNVDPVDFDGTPLVRADGRPLGHRVAKDGDL